MFGLIDFQHLLDLFGDFVYLAPFTLLLLCGVGLPLPEEVSLIGSGLLLYRGKVEFVPIVAVCSAAILLGDSIPYWLGRRYGERALEVRWVSRILHPERFKLLKERFETHGNWAIFTCRFLPGIRIPGYFMAGMLGMTYRRMLLLDSLGVLISVPISIHMGKVFGGSIEVLKSHFADFHLLLGFGVLTLILIMALRARNARRERQVQIAQEREDARLAAEARLAELGDDERG